MIKRVINARFEAMTGHHLLEPEFCNVADGWEKCIVKTYVGDQSRSVQFQNHLRHFRTVVRINCLTDAGASLTLLPKYKQI